MTFLVGMWGVWLLLGGGACLWIFGEAEWPQGWMPWFFGIYAVSLIASLTGPLRRWLESNGPSDKGTPVG